MTPSRRGSVSTLVPPSPGALRRPNSVADSRPGSRMVSDPHSETEARNVRVVLRIRPSDPDDASVPPRFRHVLLHPTSASDVRVDGDPATLAGTVGATSTSSVKKHPTFNFDHVLPENATQTELYDVATSGVTDDFMKGHNVTFLAYGQTSSGKSYSMGTTGEESDYAGTAFTPRTGLIPRTVHSIFENAEEVRQASGPGASWECRISFLELYNEEIIDILSGSGVQVAIREEKDGRIIWSGVREVKVKTLGEVMALLQDGSARRKTGETGMNATSSRSHAIFSLTLIQKRRAGIVSPPASGGGLSASASQPMFDTGSKIKRPNSMMVSHSSRSITPSGTRSTTPSGTRAGPPTTYSTQQRNTLPRPTSMQIAPLTKDDDMIIVTSKFNMVDLAGSEKLKKTAAQGDRMKEGISINSGLLALGNVISHLAEPTKARDSIGGNALTTMIACVSPIEYNISETLNTLKYASRARNIRNTARANQVEAGWDDVEHLQHTVLKLRKQLTEVGGEIKAVTDVPLAEEKQKHANRLIVRLAELQKEHTELYDRYLAKCSESMRLTTELRSARPGDQDALAKFNETVEPVIMEYEKVVAALNGQLEELREEMSTLTGMYEAQGQQLQLAIQAQTENETYVVELRGRLAKLTERDTASEGYIRDLDSKLKTYEDKEGIHTDIVSTLRKEIANHQASNAKLSEHTSELETRLIQSEANGVTLGIRIERQEKEAERREKAFKDLEAHIALLDTTEDNKALLEELQQREALIGEMAQDYRDKQAQLEQEKCELQLAHEASALVNSQLRADLAKLNASNFSRGFRDASSSFANGGGLEVPVTRPTMTKSDSFVSSNNFVIPPESPKDLEEAMIESDEVTELRRALRSLTAKYHASEAKAEAQIQIADLAAQLADGRLIHAEGEDRIPASADHRSSIDENSDESMTLQTPHEEVEGLVAPLSTATSPTKPMRGGKRGPMPNLSLVSVKGRDFRGGRGIFESRRARPQSLSQELSSAHSPGSSSRPTWAGSSLLLSGPMPSRQSMPSMKSTRSLQSLEAELKFVHEKVNERDEDLRDREAYIKQLEQVLNITHSPPSHKSSAQSLLLPQTIPLPPSPTTPTSTSVDLGTNTAGLATDLEPIPEVPAPALLGENRDHALKQSLSKLQDGPKSDGSSTVQDLLRVMATKEAELRSTIDRQLGEIEDLRKSNKRLNGELISRKPDSPIKARTQIPKVEGDSPSQPHDQSRIRQLEHDHEQEVELLMSTHAESLSRLQTEHEAALVSLRQTVDTLQATLASTRADADPAKLARILNERDRAHAEALAASERDSELLIREMESSLASNEEERRSLKMKADQAMFELSRIRDQGQLQRNVDSKAITDLKRVNSALGRTKTELETANNDLSKRLGELESRNSTSFTATSVTRRSSPLPPQGPPPNSPLPPIPKSPVVASAPTMGSIIANGTGPVPLARLASGTSLYNGSGSSQQGHAGQRSSATSITDITDIIATLPEGPQQNVQRVVNERDTALQQKDLAKQLLAAGQDKLKDWETRVVDERQKAETIARELAEARRTSAKLRLHLEDVRQEQKRQQDQCRDHTTDLEEHRAHLAKLSEEQQHSRTSLQAANAQVATLRAQLDRAVEQKVQKRLLKCF